MRSLGLPSIVSLAILLIQAASSGQDCLVESFFPPPDGIQSLRFGASVATDGELIICGAEADALTDCIDLGHVRIFRWDGAVWGFEQQLAPTLPPSTRRFGAAVSVAGDRAAIGAPGIGLPSGRTFTFRFDSLLELWIEEQVLVPADATNYDEFGASVALVGDTLFIGAPYATGVGIYTGGVYVFRFDPAIGLWSEHQKLFAMDGTLYGEFGAALSQDDGVLLVGARDTFESGSGPGSCYVYRYDPALDEWGFEQKLIASDGASRDGFGSSVSLHGELAVIGAPLDNALTADVGSCYVFRLDALLGTWAEEQKLASLPNGFQQRFGTSVCIHDDTILVGVPGDDEITVDCGAVHSFRHDPVLGSWVPEQIITASTGWVQEYFGTAIARHEDLAVIGVPQDDDEGLDAGGAITFRRELLSGDWAEEQRLPAAVGVVDDIYGASVALSLEFLVVGAPFDDATNLDSGAAFVYRIVAGDWVLEEKLLAGDGQAGDRFGSAVAISGDTIVVGAPYDDEGTQLNTGACYLFRRDPVLGIWTQEQKLIVMDVFGPSRFGSAVDIEGDVLIAGSPFDSLTGTQDGSAFVFRFDPGSGAWSEEQKLDNPTLSVFSQLGSNVAIHGEVAVVGATNQVLIFRRDPGLGIWLEEDSLPNPVRSVSLDWDVLIVGTAGGGYVYRCDATQDWQLEQLLVPSDAGLEQLANSSVAVEGTTAIIGAPAGSEEPGAAYLFRYNPALGAWTEIRKLERVDGAAFDRFGWSVAVHGDLFAVGAPLVDLPCLPISCSSCDAGSVYLFRPSLCQGFIRGDTNGDGMLDVADPITCLRVLFRQSPAVCPDSLDLNDDGSIDIADAVCGLDYLFANGPVVPDPFPECGADPTPDAYLCDDSSCP